MAYYALVHFPEINTRKIEEFRKKYDPHYKLISAHIVIVFPISDAVGESRLVNHIKNTLSKWKPFDMHISGLKKSWDQWLFLVLRGGNSLAVKLHDKLYKGLLSKYLRKDIKYTPHIGLGLFVKGTYNLKNPKKIPLDREKYSKALAKAKKLNFNYKVKVRRLHLVKLNNTFTKSSIVKEFLLNKV
jgi:hypothetical protein